MQSCHNHLDLLASGALQLKLTSLQAAVKKLREKPGTRALASFKGFHLFPLKGSLILLPYQQKASASLLSVGKGCYE